jgi:phosphoribosyl-AMP cyclohydrolase
MVVAATPISASEDQLARIAYNAEGLVPAIIQEHGTGAVLMLAWMNDASLRKTLATYDCDGDTLLVTVVQEGKGACHTGSYSCFFRSFGDDADVE